MSTALAIASVTQVLKDLLNNGLIDHDVTGAIGNVTVTALPPDRIDISPENSQLNLFMYQVTPNQGWCNVGLPSWDASGERIANPPLALDLHYLLTAYGANELHAEILLGYGMQLLHETPVLSRDAIRRALAPPMTVTGGLPSQLQFLSTSELAEQVEQIKLIHQFINTEEMSKLWSAFGAKYRPTTAYQASVVLIESRKSTKSALPVRSRKVYVTPFKQPEIEKLKSQKASGEEIAEGQQILAGYNLVIIGKRLRGEETSVNIGGIHVAPRIENINDHQIIVPLPRGLRAGIQGVQVIHRTMMGYPPEPHRGVESNIMAFVLHPEINNPITVQNLQDLGSNLYSGIINVSVNPAVGDKQRVMLFLNEFRLESGSPPEIPLVAPLSYSFHISPSTVSSPPPSGGIEIPLEKVRAGIYLARVQVDGAESPLGTDETGRYNSPLLRIPPVTSP